MNELLRRRAARACIGLSAGIVFPVAPAMAYVDPGTGSMLVQMTIAAVAGAVFYFRQFRTMVFNWVRRVILRQPVEPTKSGEPPADLSN